MNATGLDVFDKTLHSTNTWLDQLMADIGSDRQTAWHVLGAVLRALRDRLPIGLAAHLGAQLPLLVRGLYYDEWEPGEPLKLRSQDDFLQQVSRGLATPRPVDVNTAAQAVFCVLNHYVDPDQVEHVREALPEQVRALWPKGTVRVGRAEVA